jgi:tRNA 2-thiouridine synthesizing protein A
MSEQEVAGQPEVTVDARGTRCPMPVIEVARAAAGLPTGAVLLVLASDPAAAADLPAWARMRGHTLDSVQREGDDIAVRLILRHPRV